MLTELTVFSAALAALPFGREALRRSPGDLRQGVPSDFAKLPGCVTRYDWHGEAGAPVTVAIHGLTTPSLVWTPLMPLLTMMGHRVLTYDLPGRGLSDRAPGQQDAGYFCDHLAALLADQQVTGPVSLIGYSMGGAIAAAFASAHRDRVRSLTLLAPAGMGHDLGPLARIAVRVPALGDWLFHMAYPWVHQRDSAAVSPVQALPDLPDRLIAELRRKGYLSAVLSSLRHMLGPDQEAAHRAIAAAGIPVTALWGDQDKVIPPDRKEVLRAWNPQARQAVIFGAGHGLPFTHPEALLAALR